MVRLYFILESMFKKIINTLLGDQNAKTIAKTAPIIAKINQIEEEYQKNLTDEDIPKKTEEFKTRLQNGETLDDILPEAYALVKNACRRLVGKSWSVRGTETLWNMIPYDVQLVGGLVLHNGKIAEMKTGEGKTLVSTFPTYLNALAGKGVFLVTVNDYLASRDAEWNGGLFNFLGLSVGVIRHGLSHQEKKEAYSKDITYGTNNEFGFDYLRDNMAGTIEEIVQRELNYAIIDEVDSILIDEARTPLIISMPAEESTDKYAKYAKLVLQLEENTHYILDEKLKTAVLTDAGIARMEDLLGLENIYTEAGFSEVHHIEQALKAQSVYKKDTDYVVKDGEILIVDEFTGRLMPGRRYSHGLHQSIEAKENVEIKRESKTLATVSLQNYFRLFNKLAGMTGTAATEAEEFEKIYGMEVVIIPTNKPIQRLDKADVIYKNWKGKFMAIGERVKELHAKGQPVLIGTISIEKSEVLSQVLRAQGTPHKVLNAKFHEQEAEIIKNAGQKGAVTIATNMAGRGTDIKLGEGVQEVGGLVIIGTERHESRRIDNQLRGRSGRQGDPGESQFFVSMEDNLMRLFGADRIKRIMEALNVPEDMPIENSIISKSIEGAQKKVEGHNFDIRKHLVQYDDIMNWHREIIYKRRRAVLSGEGIHEDIIKLIEEEADILALNSIGSRQLEDWDLPALVESVNALNKNSTTKFSEEDLKNARNEASVIKAVKEYLIKEYEKKASELPDPKIYQDIEKQISLRTIDTLWMDHIDAMSDLREAVSLRGYGQRDPLLEYQAEAYKAFDELLSRMRDGIVQTLFKMNVELVAPQAIKQPEIKNVQTNEQQIEEVLSGHDKKASPSRTVLGATQKDPNAPKEAEVGRNDPCPCGSGKKYKKCHL